MTAQEPKVLDELQQEKNNVTTRSFETISKSYALKSVMTLEEAQSFICLQISTSTAAPGEGQENAGKALAKLQDEMKQEHAEAYQTKLQEYAGLTGEAAADVAVDTLKILEVKKKAFASDLEQASQLFDSFQIEVQAFQLKLDGMKVGEKEKTLMSNASDEAKALYEKLNMDLQQTMVQYWLTVSKLLNGALNECDGDLAAKLSAAREAIATTVEAKKSLCAAPEPEEEEEEEEALAPDEVADVVDPADAGFEEQYEEQEDN